MPKEKYRDGVTGMMVFIPDKMYREFKSVLAKEGVTVKSAIIDFVKDYIEEGKDVRKNKENSTED